MSLIQGTMLIFIIQIKLSDFIMNFIIISIQKSIRFCFIVIHKIFYLIGTKINLLMSPALDTKIK